MQSSKRVILNTGVLYGRMLLTVGITLYSTRVVLNALGSADYGIYNLITGVIAMLSFLNTAMTTSTQRYFSYYQGKKDIVIQKKIFFNSFILHIGIGLLIVLSLELLGSFIFHGFLNIPADRIFAAKRIYHLMSATVFFTIISVPFTASLYAHENMIWIAFVNIVEAVLKLCIAVSLLYFGSDKLILFGFLTACISSFSFLLYSVYCFFKFEECTIKSFKLFDKKLVKELLSFASWNLFGILCSIGRMEGMALLLNHFFGTKVNAAYGIACQVTGQLNFFSYTLMQALNPQIMKSEGVGDRGRMLKLSMVASKFGFYLLAFFAIPCIFEMKGILTFWLKNVPEYAIVFCDLVLIATLINQLTIGLQSAIQAIGKIKIYQAVVGSIILLNIPIAFVILMLGFKPYLALVSFSLIEIVACAVRMYFLKKMAGLSIQEYITRVLFRQAIPAVIVIAVNTLFVNIVFFKYRFVVTAVISTSVFLLAIYFLGFNSEERSYIKKAKEKFLQKFNRKNKTEVILINQ